MAVNIAEQVDILALDELIFWLQALINGFFYWMLIRNADLSQIDLNTFANEFGLKIYLTNWSRPPERNCKFIWKLMM